MPIGHVNQIGWVVDKFYVTIEEEGNVRIVDQRSWEIAWRKWLYS